MSVSIAPERLTTSVAASASSMAARATNTVMVSEIDLFLSKSLRTVRTYTLSSDPAGHGLPTSMLRGPRTLEPKMNMRSRSIPGEGQRSRPKQDRWDMSISSPPAGEAAAQPSHLVLDA